eukprot:CAMPEP_0119011046 /NCGR_PEP_ID=MMETSP1176-20130426/5413_1 /TAXON_ID=265551 /ORGANISM="Synedropsis recta cf, Strain CCMP1620" /LENGTH=725 /DNA_ID=CAMNT_0006963805 /DNA_START=654 /DNA_END=2831 /DNA_ORIENTATION=+
MATSDESFEDGAGIANYSIDDVDGISTIPGDAAVDTSLVVEDETASTAVDGLEADDIAKEMVLDAISGTSPDAFDKAFATKEVETVSVLTAEFLESPVPLTDDDIVANAVTIEAILAVSQQAAETADATLPAQVSESIPLIPVANFNDTMDGKPEILPATKVVGPPAAVAENFDYPSVKRIMIFAASATGVFLCSPLLSLIDTSAVGLLSGTAQQAALNPAVAVTDYAALLIAFLYTGATNLVAAAQEKDRGVEGKPVTTSSFTTALQLSTYVGVALGSILFVFARQLLGTLIGNDGISPEVFNAALKYVRIRALGMPGAAIIGSAQAGCLGMQDIKSPLYVLAAAALINLFGDMFFVGLDHPLIGGAAGAAWATVFSQYAAVAFFVRWLCTKPKAKEPTVLNLTNNILELTGEENSKGAGRRHRFNDAIKSFAKSTPAYLPAKSLANKVASVTQKLRKKPDGVQPKKKEKVTSRGLLAGKFSGRDLLKFPTKERAQEYAPYLIPVTTTQVGRVSSYIAMSHVVSSTLGTASMAAQQVIVSLFYCLTPIADSLSLTAQSVVPSLAEKKPSIGRANALRSTMKNFFKAGSIFGAAMVSAVLCIPFLSRFFTTDPGVRALVNSVAPLLIGFFSVHGVFMASEGLLLAQKDLNFIGKTYGAFFFAVPYFMLRVKKAGLSGAADINLSSVWSVFVVYQFVRFAAFMVRNLQVQRRNDRDGAKADSTMLF